jgi:hypothetical protein
LSVSACSAAVVLRSAGRAVVVVAPGYVRDVAVADKVHLVAELDGIVIEPGEHHHEVVGCWCCGERVERHHPRGDHVRIVDVALLTARTRSDTKFPLVEETGDNLHATFLLNFFDELRRRVPTGK